MIFKNRISKQVCTDILYDWDNEVNKSNKNILCSNELKNAFSQILGDYPKIVQSMYFEGNSETWEHQDSYYLDSENIGSMTAAWIALENINASAGRFFVCPKSHKIKLDNHNKSINIADNHDVYIQKVVETIINSKVEIRAPILNTGDVLFWHSKTVHGSLKSQNKKHSRSSITVHAISNSHKFLQFQTRVLDIITEEINGTDLWRPKDQAIL